MGREADQDAGSDPDRLAAQLPLEANVLFMTIMANEMPYVGRG